MGFVTILMSGIRHNHSVWDSSQSPCLGFVTIAVSGIRHNHPRPAFVTIALTISIFSLALSVGSPCWPIRWLQCCLPSLFFALAPSVGSLCWLLPLDRSPGCSWWPRFLNHSVGSFRRLLLLVRWWLLMVSYVGFFRCLLGWLLPLSPRVGCSWWLLMLALSVGSFLLHLLFSVARSVGSFCRLLPLAHIVSFPPLVVLGGSFCWFLRLAPVVGCFRWLLPLVTLVAPSVVTFCWFCPLAPSVGCS